MTYRLFLDDERDPATDGFVVVRSYEAFVAYVEASGPPSFVSFDHDLGPGRDGYDAAKWLVEYCLDHCAGQIQFEFYVHSQNPIGKQNIERYIEGVKRFIQDDGPAIPHP